MGFVKIGIGLNAVSGKYLSGALSCYVYILWLEATVFIVYRYNKSVNTKNPKRQQQDQQRDGNLRNSAHRNTKTEKNRIVFYEELMLVADWLQHVYKDMVEKARNINLGKKNRLMHLLQQQLYI